MSRNERQKDGQYYGKWVSHLEPLIEVWVSHLVSCPRPANTLFAIFFLLHRFASAFSSLPKFFLAAGEFRCFFWLVSTAKPRPCAGASFRPDYSNNACDSSTSHSTKMVFAMPAPFAAAT